MTNTLQAMVFVAEINCQALTTKKKLANSEDQASGFNQKQALLDCYAAGQWTLNNSWTSTDDNCAIETISSQKAQSCLAGKWIYILGDSSCRMFFSAVVEAINGTLQDDRFGSYKVHHKGGCVQAEDEEFGHGRVGCLREYFGHNSRLTFGFQAFGNHPNAVFENLVTLSQQPQYLLMETGAWDLGYRSTSVPGILNHTMFFLDSMRSIYRGPIIWLGLPACEPFRETVMSLNKELKASLKKYSLDNRAEVLYLDRESSSKDINDTSMCDGFHAYSSLTALHLAMFLNFICGIDHW